MGWKSDFAPKFEVMRICPDHLRNSNKTEFSEQTNKCFQKASIAPVPLLIVQRSMWMSPENTHSDAMKEAGMRREYDE